MGKHGRAGKRLPLWRCAGLFDGCSDSDVGCRQQCLASTGASGEAFGAWGECLAEANCYDSDGAVVLGCAYDLCGAELTACFGVDIPQGNLTCDELYGCFNLCPTKMKIASTNVWQRQARVPTVPQAALQTVETTLAAMTSLIMIRGWRVWNRIVPMK